MSKRKPVDVQLRVKVIPMTQEQEAVLESVMDQLAGRLVESILAKRKQQELAHGQAEPAQHVAA